MFSRFFIDRPIFASVLSIFLVLAGAIAGFALPIAQYPEITPPTVEVSANYPGANAQVVADTVAAPIEQQVNGAEDMLYMSSQCTNDGAYSLTVTFRPGIDLNMAQVLVQNRVALANPILPELVRRRGVMVKKKSPSTLMIVNLYSPDQSRNALYLSNFATIQIRDELSRLHGVGDITYLGQRDYSMRIWLDPQKMASRNLSPSDVTKAIEQQNAQVAAGQIGQPPVPSGQIFQYTMATLGRLANPDQFTDMVLKTSDGRLVKLGDVTTPVSPEDRKESGDTTGVDLGAQGYDQTCTMNGQPSVALSIFQLPGSNALETAKLVRAKMEELKETRFPSGIDYAIVYDTTPVIEESIHEVFKTLGDAVLLVAAVVLVFLQNWRSAIIPLVAVPVAIIGTFAVMASFGFSLNNLTLFGLVLAIGIVVDDAIVVVEAVEHGIEHGLEPRQATIRAMELVSGPVIAVGLVLTAVFVPCAFISGMTGQFFRQFALTIAVSTVLSAFNSLTLSPALSALLLRPRQKGNYETLPRFTFVLGGAWLAWLYLTPRFLSGLVAVSGIDRTDIPAWLPPFATGLAGAVVGWLVRKPLNVGLGWSFARFNEGFEKAANGYSKVVGVFLRLSIIVLIVYVGLLGLTVFAFQKTPTGFIPQQDKGYLLVNLQLPDAASVERTHKTVLRMEQIAKETMGVKHTVAIAGQSLLLNANAPNFGAIYVMLTDFPERRDKSLYADAIAATLQARYQTEITEGQVNVFGAPPVEGLGTAGGFKIVVEDRGDSGLAELESITNQAIAKGATDPALEDLYTSFRANTPWVFIDVDRVAARSMGVSLFDAFNMFQVYLGSLYVNDFNRYGRTWQVNVQAASKFREQHSGLRHLKVRNERGKMVPFGSFASVKEVNGPVMLVRYNMYPSAFVNANVAAGYSSGQGIARLQESVNATLPPHMKSEWTELALLQLQTGNTAIYIFILAVVLVFLVLAAQYESWSLPFSVILVVPMCLLSSLGGVLLAGMDVNIFTQIGFVVLVGLASKNSILIVEYAKNRHEQGVPRFQATLEACRLRLRPIIMTSLAFIIGVVPLVISEGAGAEMRRTLGTAVFYGMLGVTLFGIFLTPVFFYVIQWFADRGAGSTAE
jgi:multidrug efflux pump